ncbi:non-SMC mitotic condensation complex subunit 1 family protein [Theileria parva strain Muguga]|uniref:non-SMC mitotic condensation complex subunit 1 family protein n=1 Tax=Theileria parva strain Muguga TaxID=333668 RepID=UPI001C6177BE|nr:non-SMC mitotic condensation complex subunit 1 family protein [Theileria parva strain Muguga]EAN34163.2 non-SMC mitotic condensation complex subunit 1 family protein [Theileria parva strain Muguga]
MLDYTSPRNSTHLPSDSAYTQAEAVKSDHGRHQSFTWHNAVGKNNELVSIFKISLKTKDYEIVTPYDVDLAKHHVKHIKTVRHPFILKVLDSYESDSAICIITERCYPFDSKYLSSDPTLGISQVCSALNFLHKKCNLVYSMVNPYGIGVKEDGSWCLYNFELVSDIDKTLSQHQNVVKNHISFNDGWKPNIHNLNLNSVHFDNWQLGAFICWVYALISDNEERCNIKRYGFDFNSFKLIVPKLLHNFLNELFGESEVDLERVLKTDAYFKDNITFNTITFISELHIKSQFEIEEFFTKLPENINKIPVLIRCKQLLPEILRSINLCKNFLPMILDCVIMICKSIVLQDFRKHVYPSILELFKDSDKSIRFCLLKRMNELDELLDETQVSQDMFEYFYVGFTDPSPQIRGETIKSLSYLIRKINSKQKASCTYSLLKCVSDSEPTIRANSIICFAKIIPFIEPELVSKVLPQVWRNGLHDTFLKSKTASLESISASHIFLTPEDKAFYLIPMVSETLLDSDVKVRRLAFDTISKLLDSLKPFAVPESIEKSSGEKSW